MTDERPPNWDWVKAIATCKATVMFGEMKTLAKQNVDTRNGQLGGEPFRFSEPDGITFLVNHPTNVDRLANQIAFKVVGEDLSAIEVSVGRGLQRPTIKYEVRLNDQGVCKLRHDNTDFDPWQVLKSALEPLLFG
jgi:hypothetical protein